MLEPGFYPGRPEKVELRQTHISYVFLAGPEVYKIKKPVRFPFLDYSTLERRYHYCREEVRLNRRLAPGVYLGVVPILQAGGSFVLGDGASRRGEVCEYGVRMRRLPEERMLDRLVGASQATIGIVEAVADKLVEFHLSAAGEHAARYGSTERIAGRLAENFSAMERFAGRTLSEGDSRLVREFSRGFLEHNAALFAKRVAEGRVREGHGDLRAEHICLTDRVVIFDCIEFDESLRYCDVASEVAFLAMDLDFLGAPELSQRFVERYGARSRDEDLPLLLSFYRCYRACVRGKVESLKSAEPEVGEAERAEAALRARRYFSLACRYARGPLSPALVLVCGLPGAGKSTLARELGDRTGFRLENSDIVRKELAGLAPTESARQRFGGGIYSVEFTDRTYRELLRRARAALERGEGAIVDATFREPRHRRMFIELASARHVPFLFVECRAGDEEARARLRRRSESGASVSDATVEVYERQKEQFAPLDEVPPRHRLLVDAARAVEAPAAVERRLAALRGGLSG
jgi:aminoglycoside phosphotransferase family enzyme/predicted kinase